MKANKKDLKKLENYIAGLRDLIEAGRYNFKKEDCEAMAKKLESAEGVVRTIAFIVD